jgi:PilZ domain
MSNTDQLPAPRIPLKLDVEFRRSYARSNQSGAMRNISISGAFLEQEAGDFAKGDKLQIYFKVGGRARKVPAEIVWVNKRGCGIKFAPTNNRDIQIVDDLMYFVESKRQNRRSVLDDILKQAN